MDVFQNLDLLSVAVATASIVVLGFSVYFNNRQSVTNRSFLYFALLTTVWSWVNYFAYQVTDPNQSLWLFRIVIAIATWHSFFFLFLLDDGHKTRLKGLFKHAWVYAQF
jgi:hypothetical protein